MEVPQQSMAKPWCLSKHPGQRDCRRRRSKLCHQHPTQPVTLDNVTRVHAIAPSFARLQIIGGRVYLVPSAFPAAKRGRQFHDYMREYFRVLRDVADTHRMPDVDLVLNPTDGTPPWPAFNQHAGHHGQWPVRGEVPGVGPFLIPSPEKPWRAEPSSAPVSSEAWRGRRGVAAWRGSNTGFARTSLVSWSGNMRARLTVLSRMYPEALDAAITGWPQPHGGVNLSVLTRFLRGAPRTPPDYLRRYKYAVEVDGNVQSNRFRWVASRNAIVLQATRFVSAYTASLHALPHVVTIRPDLSDLVPTVRCLQRHDGAALQTVLRIAILGGLLAET